MKTRQPSIREIRTALQELEPQDGEALTDEAMQQSADQAMNHLAGRFPTLTGGRLQEAYEVHTDALRRKMAGDELMGHRLQACADFLGKNTYATLDEAADYLGLLSMQEVWDLVMDEAELPPSEAPKNLP